MWTLATIRVQKTGLNLQEEADVLSFLESNGVYYHHWNVTKLPDDLCGQFQLTDEDKQRVLSSFEEDIQALAQERGYKWWDVIALSEATPDLPALLAKFEQVHTHAEDEVRAIVSGSGTFIIKGRDGAYFDVRLSPGDVISVPEGNPHYFTLTEERQVVAVRLFIEPSGWVSTPYEESTFSPGS